MRKKNRVILTSTLSCFFTLLFYPENVPGNQTPPIIKYHGTDSLTILSWNVFLLPKWTAFFQPKNNHHWERRTEEIIHVLKNQNADIVVLQEAFNRSAIKKIKQKFQHQYFFISEPLERKHFLKAGSGLLLLSKFPISDLQIIEFDACASDDCFASKGAFQISIQFNQQTFKIVGTHLQADYRYPSQYASVRQKQLKQLRQELDQEDSTATTIYCGDFNIDYHHPNESEKMIESLHVQKPDIKKGEFTWQQYELESPEKYYYDYCLIKSNQKNGFFRTKIIDPLKSICRVRPSDHLPVGLVFYSKQPPKLNPI